MITLIDGMQLFQEIGETKVFPFGVSILQVFPEFNNIVKANGNLTNLGAMVIIVHDKTMLLQQFHNLKFRSFGEG